MKMRKYLIHMPNYTKVSTLKWRVEKIVQSKYRRIQSVTGHFGVRPVWRVRALTINRCKEVR